jgi:flagellar capping protein FliD
MTWAYQQDSTHPHFAHYDNSQEKMYKSIISVVKNVVLAKKDISAFSPAGTTVQNMRTSSLGDTITRDGFHLSFGLGRFASGLTFLHTLTGIEIEGVNFSIEGITEKEKQIAIKAAKAAVKNPFEITKINI